MRSLPDSLTLQLLIQCIIKVAPKRKFEINSLNIFRSISVIL